MTEEERRLVEELFERLRTLESAQRDPEAEALIRQGLQEAPNAPYALVQTVLVQDEALKRADARIRELEGTAAAPQEAGSFLGSMRDALLGRAESRGSVPSVPARGGTVSPAWQHVEPTARSGFAPQAYPVQGAPPTGGSFLGTAAAAAAGVIGGSLLLDGIRSMMGHPGVAHAAYDAPMAGAPSPSEAGGGLAHQAGIDDVGRSGASRSFGDPEGHDRAGLLGGDHDNPNDAQPGDTDDDGYDTDDDLSDDDPDMSDDLDGDFGNDQ